MIKRSKGETRKTYKRVEEEEIKERWRAAKGP